MVINIASCKELMKLRKYKLSKLIWENEYINCLRRNWKILEFANDYSEIIPTLNVFMSDLWLNFKE